MTTSETYVPGMNTAPGQKSYNDLYSRQSAKEAQYSGNATYVSGMDANNGSDAQAPQPKKVEYNGEPVVGFLYSISRKGIGEYWPLHLGSNTIGRSDSCDIQLNEASVSDSHATLSIKQMKSTQALIASVRDTGSKNGMYLNEEELDYDNHSCKNGDVLTIGTCYKLLLILINAKEYGLSIAENFIPYVKPVKEVEIPVGGIEDGAFRGRNQYVDDGTVDLSGNGGFISAGETKIM